MKVLWLSNVAFTSKGTRATGGWLQPLAELLIQKGNIQIQNVTFGDVSSTQVFEINGIKQYLIPIRRQLGYGQKASHKTCADVTTIENTYNPDLIHIWGTENVWCSIHAKKLFKTQKIILDIQGLLKPYSDFYLGGLEFNDILECISFKEILMPQRNLLSKARIFKKRGFFEELYINSFCHISTQSQWVRNHIHIINSTAKIYNTKIILRSEFYSATPWTYKIPSDNPILFSSCSAAVPYKGMHQLLKMTAILKLKYPKIKLCIAGNINVGNRLPDGYPLYLKKIIKKLKLTENIVYLGPLTASQIVSALQKCNVCVIPSYIETYCLALAEALIIGVPCVVSYTGALPETAIPNKEALFYNPNDHVAAAAAIDELIQNKNKAVTFSNEARKRRFIENDRETVIQTQIDIYKKVLS